MQAYYRSILGQDGPASPEERQALRHAMIDYGALQPSPVQKPNDSSRAPETPLVASSLSPQEHHQHVNCLASFFFPLHADPLASASPLSPTLPIRHLAARFLPLQPYPADIRRISHGIHHPLFSLSRRMRRSISILLT